MTFNKGDTVILETFHGSKNSPDTVDENNNYWKLIGSKGKVVDSNPMEHPAFPDKGTRILVQFEPNLSSLGLNSHNDIENSLWLFISDVRVL